MLLPMLLEYPGEAGCIHLPSNASTVPILAFFGKPADIFLLA
jgi:hypothetical protein